MAGVIDRLKGHSACESTVADHCDALEGFATVVPGQGNTERRGDGRAGMAGTEGIEAAFGTFQITGNTTLLAERIELLVTASDQFVRIGLMAHIPDHLVVVEIKGLIKGQGELNNPQPRSEMSSAGGDNFQMSFSDLCSYVL